MIVKNHAGQEARTDEAIIDLIVLGDRSLFEVLVRRYNQVLYKIARGYGFNHQDAQDLMQDAHVAAFMDLAKFEKRASYKTWISRIMINRCLYKLKYGYFKNEVPGLPVVEAGLKPLYIRPGDNQTEKVVMNHELSAVLEKSLHSIPLMYRTVFVLRVMEGFSVIDTATLLDITPINVKVRLNRAKALLQKQMEQVYSFSELYSFNLIYCDAIVERVFERINALDPQ